MPKSEGESEGEMYMASGFTAREFGLGLGSRLAPAIRNEINESHRRNKSYMSMGNAELVKGSTIKRDFKDLYRQVLPFSELEFNMRAIGIALMLSYNSKMLLTRYQ
jgi:hypothetical protein